MKNENILSKLVEKHIIHNASELVNSLLNSKEFGEEINNLFY